MKQIAKILFSYWTTLILLILLGVGAAVATFIENDFGTETAQVLVYRHLWYEVVMVLTIINLIGIMYLTKMWKKLGRFTFHLSFVVILLGAGATRYYGYEGVIHIREGKTENRMISLEPYLQIKINDGKQTYYQEYQFNMSALGGKSVNDFNYNIEFGSKVLNVKFNKYLFEKKGRNEMAIIVVDVTLDGKTKKVELMGKRGMKGTEKTISMGDTTVTLEYGSKTLYLPFSIKLNDFQLERYPGSMSPSSYASEVTVIPKDGKPYDYRIYMNNTLHHGNYLFFQSSYDMDEKGTILSVNNDPGKWPTYLGYFLLTLGLLINLFDKKSRFLRLSKYLKQFNSLAFVAFVAFALNTPANAKVELNTKETLDGYLTRFKNESAKTAKLFGKLVTQSSMGRMKPLNTLNTEIVQKLNGSTTIHGMNPDQIVLGMLTRPEMWRFVKMIKIKTPKLKKLLGIDLHRNKLAFNEVFEGNKYKLQQYVSEANRIKPGERGTFERDVLKIDERLNIAYMVYYGNLFKIFPRPDYGHGHNKENKWYNPLDAMNEFHDKDKEPIEKMIRGFVGAVANYNFDEANKYITFISQYQRKVGADVMPSESQIENEIFFNSLNIFPKVTIAYVLLGFIMLIVSFMSVFNKNLTFRKLNIAFFVILAILFTAQTFGMGLRWVISGHAPWSDTYESLIYIAWSAMLAGVVFFRKNLLALSASVIVAGIFMFTAHLSNIDPQITNLVPVLKSYWLTIHVSIITGSYGFLGMGAVLGFMSLILFVFRDKKRPHLDDAIKQMTAINEMALIIGLSALVVGNFIGGVWANESWGRYWGWDPKETWAYVSIVVYILVLHLRFIKKLDNPFVFASASLLAFGAILMTYFGVNFYLSGMHSYATGDPVPVPAWVYILSISVFALIAIASRKRDLSKIL